MQGQGQKQQEPTLGQVCREHLQRVGVRPSPSIHPAVSLARWALGQKDQVEVQKHLRYPMSQFLERLEAEDPANVEAWLSQGQPLNPQELRGMLTPEAAAECLEKVRLRMSAEGMLEQAKV